VETRCHFVRSGTKGEVLACGCGWVDGRGHGLGRRSKCFMLEVHTVMPEGLKLVLETRLYGRVGTLSLVRLPVHARTDAQQQRLGRWCWCASGGCGGGCMDVYVSVSA
jgi:hypothetical protein